jgi:hypothetical protein
MEEARARPGRRIEVLLPGVGERGSEGEHQEVELVALARGRGEAGVELCGRVGGEEQGVAIDDR